MPEDLGIAFEQGGGDAREGLVEEAAGLDLGRGEGTSWLGAKASVHGLLGDELEEVDDLGVQPAIGLDGKGHESGSVLFGLGAVLERLAVGGDVGGVAWSVSSFSSVGLGCWVNHCDVGSDV